MKLSVIIPAYNEEATIVQVVRAVLEAALPDGIMREIIVVNDGSSDRTAQALTSLGDPAEVKVIHQPVNRGKTEAIRRGIQEASGELLLIQDADLEYNPREYPKLLAPLLSGTAGAVYGSRFLGSISRMEPMNRFANVASNMTFNILFGAYLTDINTCYKLFHTEDIKALTIISDHFAFETEVTAKLVKKGIRIVEVPITYEARTRDQGKKIDWPRALGMYGAIWRYRFSN
jgi:glycosyltransferase involved in cell wall biosynthesis